MANEELDSLERQDPPAIKLELTLQELNTVMAALQELPHRVVDQLLRKLMTQAQPQVNQVQKQ
jgi:hypothetical protein